MAIDPTWIAIIGTVCGGVGLKVAEHWLGRNKVKNEDAAHIRDELRIEINSQREEIKELEKDVIKWREEYYDLRDKYMKLDFDLAVALQKIKEVASAPKQEQPPTP